MLDWSLFEILLVYMKTPSDALSSGDRQNGALHPLKLQDGLSESPTLRCRIVASLHTSNCKTLCRGANR